MRIVHIAAGLPPSGGLTEAVARLAVCQRTDGHDVTLISLAGVAAPVVEAARKKGVAVVQYGVTAGYFSWGMLRGLGRQVAACDVVHIHSNWTFPVWWGCWLALKRKKPLVLSPHGCLDPVRLRHSAWKKRMVGWVDRACLRRASLVHVTSDAEREWTRAFSRKSDLPLFVLPDGVDAEIFTPAPPQRHSSVQHPPLVRTVLFMGRLHPLKGLDLLLDAWALLAAERSADRQAASAPAAPPWQLIIAGPDEQGTLARLKRQAERLGLAGLNFVGPLAGEARVRAIRQADLFILPTRSENFGIAVAEALACGVPVITTRAAPWSELLGNSDISKLSTFRTSRCGWWVDVAVAPLAEALREAMGLTDDERRMMGENGRRLIERKYRWEPIAAEMVGVYQRIPLVS